MRYPSRALWFNRLQHADAVRFTELEFGTPGEDIISALRTLNRQLSPAIHRRSRVCCDG